VVALAADPKVGKKSGRVFSSWGLAREYGFTDLDGTRSGWGNYAWKRYGKYKICDERFYSYWVPWLVELMFPDLVLIVAGQEDVERWQTSDC
jgi:hypothetical protein